MIRRTSIRYGLPLLLLSCLVATGPGRAGSAAQEKPLSFADAALSVRRDAASRTIHVELSEAALSGERAARRKGGLGKVKVKNKSPLTSAIYWSLDDAVTPWFYVDTLPPGWKVKFKLPKKAFYLLAAEDPFLGDNGFWEWGPHSFYLKKRFKWTLLY
jgi:hypothetical protein